MCFAREKKSNEHAFYNLSKPYKMYVGDVWLCDKNCLSLTVERGCINQEISFVNNYQPSVVFQRKSYLKTMAWKIRSSRWNIRTMNVQNIFKFFAQILTNKTFSKTFPPIMTVKIFFVSWHKKNFRLDSDNKNIFGQVLTIKKFCFHSDLTYQFFSLIWLLNSLKNLT